MQGLLLEPKSVINETKIQAFDQDLIFRSFSLHFSNNFLEIVMEVDFMNTREIDEVDF